MNPTRSLVPASISGHVHHLWIYIMTPVVCAFLGVLGPLCAQIRMLFGFGCGCQKGIKRRSVTQRRQTSEVRGQRQDNFREDQRGQSSLMTHSSYF